MSADIGAARRPSSAKVDKVTSRVGSGSRSSCERLVFGSSAGRALVGYLSPLERQGEFFGLWGVSVKLSSILGPITYGAIVALTGGEHRLAFLVTGVYFLAGLALLAGVDVRRGREAAIRG